MVEQAQLRPDAFAPDGFFPVKEEQQQFRMMPIFGSHGDLGYQQHHHHHKQQCQQILSGTVLSGQQKSDVTCNGASGSKKRTMDQRLIGVDVEYPQAFENKSAVQVLCNGKSRLEQSAMASTSGRTYTMPAPPAVPTVAGASPSDNNDVLTKCVYHRNLEVGALFQAYNAKLKAGLEEAHNRHSRSLVSTVEAHYRVNLLKKDAEMERANMKILELEEQLRLLASENHFLMTVARNNEATVSSLRTSLEQALLHSSNSNNSNNSNKDNNNNNNNNVRTEEGFGDSGDAMSGCYDDEVREGRLKMAGHHLLP